MTDHTSELARGRRANTASVLAAAVVLAGAAKEIIIARTFGVNNDLDFYLLMTAMPLALVSLYGNSWQSAALPELADDEANLPGSRYWFIVSIMVIPLTLVCVGAAALAAQSPSESISGEARSALFLLLVGVACALGLTGASWYPVALAKGRGYMVVAAPAAVHVGIAVAVLSVGPAPLALYGGLLLGQVLLAVVMRAYAVPRGVNTAWMLSRRAVRRIFSSLWPIAGGGAAMALALPIDLLFAAQVGAGGPSIVNYSTRVPLAASVVGAASISTVAFVDFVSIRTNPGELGQQMRRWLVRSAGFGILAAVAIWFTSEPIANLLWESDRLSGAELQSVVEVQRFAALFIPPFLVSMVFVRSFNAIGTNLPLLWVSLANIAVNVAGNYLLAPRFGLEGIMVSTALMYLSSGYLLRMAWRRTLRRA